MRKLLVSVSGGRTSGYMAWWLKNNLSDRYEMIFVFANTGQEHLDTLRFLSDLDKNFNLNLILVEAVVHSGKKKSTTHKVVTFETLSITGGPFEAVVSKYGVSNQVFKSCSREMKRNTIRSYCKSIGWIDYETAIGIRIDEKRRVADGALKEKIIYPLVDFNPVDKPFILDWWSQFEWDLKIPEYLGNCLTCYKKSEKKLYAVYQENPLYFRFFDFLEKKYGWMKPAQDKTPGPRVFFRGYRSTEKLLNIFRTFNNVAPIISNEESGGCSESCEIYETEE